MRRNNLNGLLLISILTIVVLFQFSNTSFAQTTAFNFQGRLNDGANPANGNFELQFALFDSLAGGSQIGSTVTRPSVAVINGIFSTQLDFGAAAFSGAARFVEIGVRPSGSSIPFTILVPRQQVLSAPYAIQAKNAAQLGGIDAAQYVTTATVGNSFIRNDTTQQSANINISGNGFFGGNVGIGTAAPDTKLQVQSSGYGITQTSGGVTVGSFISTAGGGSGWFGTRSNHPLNFFTNDSLPRLTLSTAGNFGIGTTAPTAKLEVLGVAAGQVGVYAESPMGRAIWGKSISSRGVYGESDTLEGIYGISVSGAGVAGRSTSNVGVYGESFGPVGVGIYARNLAGGRAIYAEGNVTQTLASHGVVKATIHVNPNGGINRCYNGITNASTGGCGFVVTRTAGGKYTVNFNFQIDNRFIVGNAFDNSATGCLGSLLYIMSSTGSSTDVVTLCGVQEDAPFTLVVY